MISVTGETRLTSVQGLGRVKVKMRNTPCEQIFSALPSNPDIARSSGHFAFGPMLSKKSFWGNKRNFLKLMMRFVRSDVRDHIVSQKKRPRTFVSALQSIAAAE
jgi:hypothetical protein